MQGWSEIEIRNRDLMAPCGLYCGTCSIYLATRDRNEKLKAVLGSIYGTEPAEIECYGCMQVDPVKKLYSFCTTCALRKCIKARGYYSCHQCSDWPCSLVENLPYATGVRVIKRAIPIWRNMVAKFGHEDGTIEWARSECERYHCPHCGKPLFRGAQHCRTCKTSVAHGLDGSF